MAGMGGGNAMGAVGSMGSDIWNMVAGLDSYAQGKNDQQRILASLRELAATGKLSYDQLKIAAEQMGVQPDVLASTTRNNQLNALRQMENIASRGGLDDAAVAANQQAGMQAARQNQANQQAIQANMQRRGLQAGSGAQLAQRQMSNQAAYNTVSMEGANNAAAAQMRALQAIQSAGRLSGDIASAEEARNADNINRRAQTDRFNTSIRNAANQFNSNAQTRAAGFNLDRGQAIAGATNAAAGTNTGIRRQNRQDMQDTGQHFANFSNSLGSMMG